MEDNKFSSDLDLENLSHAQRCFVESENICPLCNNQVKIKVRSYLENFNIAEEAHCEACQMTVRTKNHKIN